MKIQVNSSYEERQIKEHSFEIDEESFLKYTENCIILDDEDLENLLYDFVYDEHFNLCVNNSSDYVEDSTIVAITNIDELLKHFSHLVEVKEEEEKYLLVKLSLNWSDEFDLYGLSVMTEERFNTCKDNLNSLTNRTYEIYFGTNEAVDISPADLLAYTTVLELPKNVYDYYVSYIGSEFGTLTFLECYERIMSVAQEWEGDNDE